MRTLRQNSRDYCKTSQKVRFDGDNYSKEWIKEAEKRGLTNITDTPRSLDAYLTEKTKSLHKNNQVCSERELEARHEILLKNYILKIQIEARVLGDLALNHILPTAFAYQNKLIKNATGLKSLGVDNRSVIATLETISKHIQTVESRVSDMTEERKKLVELGT